VARERVKRMIEFRSAVPDDFPNLVQFKHDIHRMHVHHARCFSGDTQDMYVLEVWDWKKDAIGFYQSPGFQTTQIRMKLWLRQQG
jgi:hypothetical protein